jgi:hypothetical protein
MVLIVVRLLAELTKMMYGERKKGVQFWRGKKERNGIDGGGDGSGRGFIAHTILEVCCTTPSSMPNTVKTPPNIAHLDWGNEE